ncbi:MAG TPA: chorismate mutase, partial [Ilumatobacteraceae bacterium]
MADLDDLRARIDQLDGALIAIVAERLAVCRQVAAVKEGTDTPVIQPARVRDVVDSRRRQAIDAGIDPDFAEQLFRVLLTETHRIEVAGQRPDAAPEKPATTGEVRSGLDTVATRVDHIVVAVEDLDLATSTLQTR